MVQRTGCASLPVESAERVRIVGEVLGQEFQCHDASEANVFGLVNYTHPTCCQVRNYLIVRNRGAVQIQNRVGIGAPGLLMAFLSGQLFRDCFQSGRLDKTFGGLAIDKEGLYFAPQIFILRARCVQKRLPVGFIVFQRGVI